MLLAWDTMSAKAVREHYGKQLIAKWLPEYSNGRHTMENKSVLISPDVLDPSKGKTFDDIAEVSGQPTMYAFVAFALTSRAFPSTSMEHKDIGPFL